MPVSNSFHMLVSLIHWRFDFNIIIIEEELFDGFSRIYSKYSFFPFVCLLSDEKKYPNDSRKMFKRGEKAILKSVGYGTDGLMRESKLHENIDISSLVERIKVNTTKELREK